MSNRPFRPAVLDIFYCGEINQWIKYALPICIILLDLPLNIAADKYNISHIESYNQGRILVLVFSPRTSDYLHLGHRHLSKQLYELFRSLSWNWISDLSIVFLLRLRRFQCIKLFNGACIFQHKFYIDRRRLVRIFPNCTYYTRMDRLLAVVIAIQKLRSISCLISYFFQVAWHELEWR